MLKEEMLWYWFVNIPGVGRKTQKYLLDIYSSPSNLYQATHVEISRYIKNEKVLNGILDSKDEEKILKEYEVLSKKNIKFIHCYSENYPESLKHIDDSPLGLYIKGKFPVGNQKSIAVIGSRNCTRYGREMAAYFGRELSLYGFHIVSGLAYGIDGAAHKAAIEAGGYTIGVLGCGIDWVYPKENYDLFIQTEKHGCIVSEYNMGIPPKPGFFPERNRIISGISDGILVVEAKEKSGTFITVDYGLEQGKDIFAIPGRILDKNSVGCNNLIKYGAHVVTDVSDILDIYCMNENKTDKLVDVMDVNHIVNKNLLAPTEKMVYSCLQIEPKYLDDIISEVKIAPQEICKALNQLVLKGIIAETSRNYYAIKIV